jgi:peptidoglycan/LPS O-acetylase OafA/YrhL
MPPAWNCPLRMNKHFSLYLDLIRFVAALLVVLTHFCQHGIISAAGQTFLPQFGREAVIVFFVLSGFVIAYTTGEKAVTARQYAVARCARVYSVALPVLLVTLLAVAIVTLGFDKQVNSAYQLNKPYIYLPLHLLFAGELWGLSETPPWLLPYWSLGYEVWYYALFGVLFYARGKARLALGAAVLLIMGPKLWLLLPVWVSGVLLYRYRGPLPISTRQARLAWLATIAALLLYKLSGTDVALREFGTALWPFHSFKLGSADRYLADYVVCALVVLNFLFARHAQFAGLQRVAGPIRAVAAYTFTLYLTHAPVMGMWRAFYRHDNTRLLDILALSACIGVTCYLFGFITERRRAMYRAWFDSLFSLSFRVTAFAAPRRGRPE